MMRWCPNCQSERPPAELVCQGDYQGATCGWALFNEPLRAPGWRPEEAAPTPPPTPVALHCPNGHLLADGDLICAVCGADVIDLTPAPPQPFPQPPAPGPHGRGFGEAPVAPPRPPAVEADADATRVDAPNSAPTAIAGWRLERRLASDNEAEERFEALRETDGMQAVLTLYAPGREPDPDVFAVLRTLDRDHVPEILDFGRWQGRAYAVSERFVGETLADLRLAATDEETLNRTLAELGGALASFAELGLRHRDLRPSSILIRTRDPLDLVITGFGSARLSEYDLDIVAPLAVTRYSAPEAVLGGVAAASDWWSLGMMLLDQVTGGACFAGADDQTFLISVVANGAPIPDDAPPRVALALRGLLAVDRRERWSWTQLQDWLAGGEPDAPSPHRRDEDETDWNVITLGGRPYTNPARFAQAAADAENWEQAWELARHGELLTWLEASGLDARMCGRVRSCLELEDTADDLRFALVLKALNPNLPLIVRGEIVTPKWLLDHPEAGYALIVGPVPDRLAERDSWLLRLKTRAKAVRERARLLDVELDEDRLRVNLLSTSRSRLAAVWQEQHRALPDTDHPGLLAIIERRVTAEEDLILLLSAASSQFRAADAIVDAAEETARLAGLPAFDRTQALAWLERPRREMHAAIDERLQGFARCGLDRADEWADQFRVEKRLPVERALTLLALPAEAWRELPKQTYLATLLDFYSRRITGAIMRGPLTRMVIGKTTPRVDVTELGSARVPASMLLDHILLRSDRTIPLDPAPLVADPEVERRLRRMHATATLYRRDTGIDGLYLGFPFLVMQERKANIRPRIAPILLWPAKVSPAVGGRGTVDIGFDRDREEVRLNPAFATLLGPDAAERWQEVAKDILGRASLSAKEATEAFAPLVAIHSAELQRLPSKDLSVKAGEDRVVCAATFFHLGFLGQAVMEDLLRLRSIAPAGTSLETALRVGEPPESPPLEGVAEIDRFFATDCDPSQQAAVLEARKGAGLLVEGPPGTGKSQTIVNMVADAIGSGRSLLVVCQKQAALEVVHKRLEAAGLGERVVMVGDVNRDREPVIRAVREQLETLFGARADARPWLAQRQRLAARIEALEAELNGHHHALHSPDPQTGLSYRLLLAELIERRAEGDAPSAPTLRRLLAPFDPGEIARLEETCGPAAAGWLAARFENSPLHATLPGPADEATVAALAGALDEARTADARLLATVRDTPAAIALADAEAGRGWLAEQAPRLRDLPPHLRDRLGRWHDRLQGARSRALGRTPFHDRAAQIAATLAAAPTDAVSGPAHAWANALSDGELVSLDELGRTATARPTLLQRLSPRRWRARSRWRATLAERALTEETDALAALRREAAARPPRRAFAALLADLRLKDDGLDAKPPAQTLGNLQELVAQLDEVEALVAALEAHPAPDLALAAARAASPEALVGLSRAIEHGLARAQAVEASLRALAPLDEWMSASWLDEARQAVRAGRSNDAQLAAMRDALPHLPAFQRFRARAKLLDGAALSIFAALALFRAALEDLPPAEVEGVVRRMLAVEARLAWKGRIETANPVLLLETAELDARVDSLKQADVEMRGLNRRLLAENVDLSRLAPLRGWEDITRLRGARARRLREFVDRGADLGLMRLRPVWLVNPDVASRLLPLRKSLFDAVIYDEASQMPVEYALPTLFRSRAMVVSGDEKQMPPTAFFTSRVESDEDEIYEGADADDAQDEAAREAENETWNRREIKDCPDLLQLAKSVLPARTLQIHYRSTFRELIQFSNAAFYGDRLSVPARHPAEEIRRRKPIELVRVDGVYDAQTNAAEAERVVELVAERWQAAGPRPTIGVVTFNRKQADLIEEVLERRAEADAGFRAALSQERDRVERGEDMGFFVKNVENVQGDERDLIIFSSTFGQNAQGTFRRVFGVLGQSGGERRLNVAVTRAREKVTLVSSMPIHMISDLLGARRQASSPRDYLQAYFEYARALTDGELDTAGGLLARLMPERQAARAGATRDPDGIERDVETEIRRLGWTPTLVQDNGAFGLDYAIEDPRTGLFGLGIECDAPRHPLLADARARELWRPSVLSRSVGAVHRVSSHGWYHQPERERARLRAAIEQAMGGTA